MALADVLVQIQKAQAYLYLMTSTATMTLAEDKTIQVESQGSVLVSPEHGMKMVMEVKDLAHDETGYLSDVHHECPS